jgi:hypothetical protein
MTTADKLIYLVAIAGLTFCSYIIFLEVTL